MNCPLIQLKTCCEIAGLPDGCPLRTAQCPLEKPKPETGTFTDPRDGRTYRTVKIGKQVWMAENLAFDYAGSKCYNNDLANAEMYGRLYDWETAKKACPPGWHLPSRAEWDELGKQAIKLKAESGWKSDGNGTDDYGFSALPGGLGYSGGGFSTAGNYGYWWSSAESSSDYAYYRLMYYSREVASWNCYGKDYLFSVRCLQDEKAA